MSRLSLLSLALLVPTLAASAQSPTARPEVQMRAPVTEAQPLPGFRLSPNPQAETPRPALTHMHPRPVPLAPAVIGSQLAKFGIGRGPIQPYVQTIKYQIETFGNNYGAEVNASSVDNAIFYGADGYVQADFSVQPGKQYLLDCSIGEDGTFKIGTTWLIGNGGPGFLVGQISSFNRHLLIPMNPAPANAQSGRVVIHFTEIEFYGCQVDTVSQ